MDKHETSGLQELSEQDRKIASEVINGMLLFVAFAFLFAWCCALQWQLHKTQRELVKTVKSQGEFNKVQTEFDSSVATALTTKR